jgi:hypothetical protein
MNLDNRRALMHFCSSAIFFAILVATFTQTPLRFGALLLLLCDAGLDFEAALSCNSFVPLDGSGIQTTAGDSTSNLHIEAGTISRKLPKDI